MSAWAHLAVAIFFEICATTLLKMSEGFMRPIYAVASVALYAVCFWGLSLALRDIPMGIAYGIWSGVGIAGATLIGWALFGQNLSGLQVFLIAVLAAAAIGLAMVTSSNVTTAEAVMVPVPPNVEPAATALAQEAETLIHEAEQFVAAFAHHDGSRPSASPPGTTTAAPDSVENQQTAGDASAGTDAPAGSETRAGAAARGGECEPSSGPGVKPPAA